MKLEHIEAKTGSELAKYLNNLLEHISESDRQRQSVSFAKIIYAIGESPEPWHAFVFYEKQKEENDAQK